MPPWDAPKSLSAPAAQVNLFEEATRLETLQRAWQKVSDNAGCAGGTSVTIERYSTRVEQQLFDIPKPDGGQRRLAVPAVVDRIAQTAIAQTLTPTRS